VFPVALASVAGLVSVAGLASSCATRPRGDEPRHDAGPAAIHGDTAKQLAQGRYLVEHVTVCVDCHSRRDFTRYAGPPIEGSVGGGGQLFGHAAGFPGEVWLPNITSDSATGTGAWSDADLERAIRDCVAPNGRPLAPFMPCHLFAQLSDTDLAAIVAWLRVMPPVHSPPLRPPVLDDALALQAAVGVPHPVPDVDPTDAIARGRYLATIAQCVECHTPLDAHGAPQPGMEYAGGMPFNLGRRAGTVYSANLTPDPATGLRLSEDAFVGLFQSFRPASGDIAVPDPGADFTRLPDGDADRVAVPNTEMPWIEYSGMSEDDLRTIYRYLRSLPPVTHAVPDGASPP
jgi:mono/diheme cytochrome c family protein